jgi:hypothetical protein
MNLSKARGKKIIKSDGRKPKRKSRNQQLPRRLPYINTVSRLGSQALRDVSWLRQFVNTEIHNIDTTASPNFANTSTLVLLNGCTIGDTASTRTGQSIRMNALDLNCYIIGNATAVLQSVRVMVVLDKQANAAAYSPTGLLNNDNTISMYAIGGQNRYVVYKDEMYALSTAGPLNCQFSWRVQLNQHTEYNTGTAGTIADINSNSLYLQFVCDQIANFPILAYYARLYFVDN